MAETYQKFITRKNVQFKLGKEIAMKDIGRNGKVFYKIVARTFMLQSNLADKVFVIERLRQTKIEGKISHPKTDKIGDQIYRIGYYIIAKNGKSKGKWVWGQFCPTLPIKDLKKLLDKAKKEKTVI